VERISEEITVIRKVKNTPTRKKVCWKAKKEMVR
jgi:hypothetical protein